MVLMSNRTTQLSLFHDVKQTYASLTDFVAPSFMPLNKAVARLHSKQLSELYIYGIEGSGKTHLLTAIFNSYNKIHGTAILLSFKQLLSADSSVFLGLENFNLILIDDIDLIGKNTQWQEALFHLINRLRDHNCQIVFSSKTLIIELPFEFIDLTTRLAQMLIFTMPDGTKLDDKKALINAMLSSKGWVFNDEIIEYMLHEGPQLPRDIMIVLSNISGYFTHRNGTKISKKLINEVITAN